MNHDPFLKLSLESCLACDLSGGDKGVDLVGAFIGVNAFKVHHLLNNVVLKKDAVSSEYLSGNLAYFSANSCAICLGESNLSHRGLSLLI
jgi:hypothetical protein